jgi:hypothetical protein
MYAFGVTLWEIFSGHIPYDTESIPQHELKAMLTQLLMDHKDPLRPDLELVDIRVRSLLQVHSSFVSEDNIQLIVAAALLGHGS